MSALEDRKLEHERKAIECVNAKNFTTAYQHAAQAALASYQLAEQSEGAIADKYAKVGKDLRELAIKLQAKAEATRGQAKPGETPKKSVAASGTEGDDGKGDKTWQLQERPQDRLADVAGLVNVKEQLQELVIDPFRHPEVYQRFKAKIGGGVLMYGPPGNGKTFVARAIAGELDAAFFLVDSSQIKDKYVGESEKKLTSLFKEARAHNKAVIFLDEVDDLLSSRGNQKIGTVTTFLKLADGFVKDDSSCLLILAATNKPWMMSPAVLRPGRLGTHIYVGPPDEPARAAIFKYTLGAAPLGGVDLAAYSKKTEGYSGAELAEVCEHAKRRAIRRQIETGQEQAITNEDIDAAMNQIRPRTGPDQIAEFTRWHENVQGVGSGAKAGSESDEGDED